MFFFPFRDDNPHDTVPVVTWALIALCVIVFLWHITVPAQMQENAILSLGMIPAVLFGTAMLADELYAVPAWATIVTSMFLHGGFMHIAGNMLYLWIFGDNVEASMGRVRFVVFYVICGIAAALTQALTDPASTVPMIGSSGAIAGVLGAYLLLCPRANVRVLFIFIVIFRVIAVPAMIVLGVWFAMQLWQGATVATEGGGVAFWAHIGGFVAGVVLVPFFKKRDVPLFGGARTRAFEVAPATPFRRRGSVPDSRPGSWTPRN